MRTVIFLSILLGNGVDLLSQTYISLNGGVDISKIVNFDSISVDETNLTLLENGFSIESPVVGLRLKKVLTKNIFLSIGTEYTHKRIKAANIYGFVSPKAISFNYLRNNIAINFKFNKYIVGLAGHYNFISSLNYIYSSGQKDKFNTTTNEAGIKLITGYEVKKFEISLYYYRGLDSVQDARDMVHWKPIESIGVVILYNLQL